MTYIHIKFYTHIHTYKTLQISLSTAVAIHSNDIHIIKWKRSIARATSFNNGVTNSPCVSHMSAGYEHIALHIIFVPSVFAGQLFTKTFVFQYWQWLLHGYLVTQHIQQHTASYFRSHWKSLSNNEQTAACFIHKVKNHCRSCSYLLPIAT